MKLLIASDIHGAAGYCRDLLAAWDREGADRLLLLGDLLYHGPRNDLPPDYAPKEVIALLNARKNQIFCVRGNCDTEVDQMVLEFPVLADYAVLTAGSRLLWASLCRIFSARTHAKCTTRYCPTGQVISRKTRRVLILCVS
jgi:predicted phosphodiesterase